MPSLDLWWTGLKLVGFALLIAAAIVGAAWILQSFIEDIARGDGD